ncbi:hypothetical protein JCM8097_007150 [Rhodosporidiobolus ruineniae]
MPAPQATYVARTSDKGFDPATLSDDEDAGSDISRSTWASASDATILGLVDGFMPPDEVEDWKVSRVGGLPSFPLAAAPPTSAATCLSCSRAMPLLTQLYVPLADSALERVVYVFGCPRAACRKKDGSVRAWRANALWVEGAEAERKKAEEDERREREKQERAEKAQKIDLGGMIFGGAAPPAAGGAFNPFAPPPSASSNPFALPSSSTPAANPFAAPAASSNPFAPPPPAAASSSSPPPPAEDFLPSASTSSWSTGPSYPSQYINTMYEPAGTSVVSSSSTQLAKQLASTSLADPASSASSSSAPAKVDDGLSDSDDGEHRAGKGAGGRTKKGAAGGQGRKDGSGKTKTTAAAGSGSGSGGAGEPGWAGEGYEVQKVKGVDEVFLRFQEKVSREGRQVLRYEHAGAPLPFSASSAAYRSTHPSSSSSSSPAVGDAVGHYAPSRLPRCRTCSAPGTFEYQLMPHLVHVLNSAAETKGTSLYVDAEGKALDKGEKKEEDGLEFATVWVVSCERECADAEGEAWREEGVLVEWEEE